MAGSLRGLELSGDRELCADNASGPCEHTEVTVVSRLFGHTDAPTSVSAGGGSRLCDMEQCRCALSDSWDLVLGSRRIYVLYISQTVLQVLV